MGHFFFVFVFVREFKKKKGDFNGLFNLIFPFLDYEKLGEKTQKMTLLTFR